jgi:transcriptional regulatory protein LevR
MARFPLKYDMLSLLATQQFWISQILFVLLSRFNSVEGKTSIQRLPGRAGGECWGWQVWQNQPELYRLKYASPQRRTNSHFKRYKTIGLSGNVPMNHRTQDLTRYLTRRWVQRYNAKIIYTTGSYITKIYKITFVLAEESLLQYQFKLLVKAAEFEKRS